MRNFFKRTKAKIIGAVTFVKAKARGFAARVRDGFRMRTAQTRVMLAANRGENFVDSGIKILIAWEFFKHFSRDESGKVVENN